MKPISFLALALTFLVTLTGCGGKKRLESSDNLKQLSAATIAYHEAHGAWPDSLEQLKPLVGKQGPAGVIGHGKTYEQLLHNPLTGDDPGYEYVKPPAADVTELPVVLYQLKGGKRDASLPVAYRDGSVREVSGSKP